MTDHPDQPDRHPAPDHCTASSLVYLEPHLETDRRAVARTIGQSLTQLLVQAPWIDPTTVVIKTGRSGPDAPTQIRGNRWYTVEGTGTT